HSHRSSRNAPYEIPRSPSCSRPNTAANRLSLRTLASDACRAFLALTPYERLHALVVTGWDETGRDFGEGLPRARIVARPARPSRELELLCLLRRASP